MKYESYEHLLEDIKENGINTDAYTLLQIQDWFISSFKFDPVSNEPIVTNFDSLLRRIPELEKYSTILWPNDRLQNIIDFSSSAIYSLMDELHEKNIREHLVTKIQHVRETDSSSIRYLSKKPGRTIKQKIASDQKMLGVFHNTTLDNSENRLFKAFLKRLDELLYLKEDTFGYDSLNEEQKDFNNRIHRWLNGEEAELIGQWGNLPPNNTLLNDRNYRKIWKSWNKLQALDESVEEDSRLYKETKNTVLLWELSKKLNKSSDIQLFQQPIRFKYDSLTIALELKQIYGFIRNANIYQRLRIEINDENVFISINETKTPVEITGLNSFKDITSMIETICTKYFPKLHYKEDSKNNVKENRIAALDISSNKPFFATAEESGRVPFKLLNQIWSINDEKLCVPGFYSKLLRNGDVIDNYSIKSFYADEENVQIDDLVATADVFAEKISSYLNTMKCIYIVPDHFDDFSPVQRCLRNSINSHFIEASPIPKSIAAVFAETKKRKILPGTEINVVDKYDDYWIYTKIIAVLDKELLEMNPLSDGVVFERYPANIITKDGLETVFNGDEKFIPKLFLKKECELLKDKLSINAYHFSNSTVQNINIPDFSSELNKIEEKNYSNKNVITIEIKDNICSGALILEDLQNLTPAIPLWKDHLPPLYIKVDSDGVEKRVDLVNKNHGAIRPKRGISVPIAIPVKDFILPRGKKYYEFPLVQGDNKNRKQSYFALLESDKFPLKEDTLCELHLTYTYGNEYPYELKFKSVYAEAEVKSVTVQWKINSKRNWLDLPSPDFGKENTWADLYKYIKRNGEITNLLQSWLPAEFEKINTSQFYPIIKKLNKSFGDEEAVFLRINSFDSCICYVPTKYNLQIGDSVWCYVKQTQKGLRGCNPIFEETDRSDFSSSLRFPVLSIWNNGRSINDSECPKDFKNITEGAIQTILDMATNTQVPITVREELYFFLCSIHKDTPPEVSKYLIPELLKNENLRKYHRHIGFSLGDCSQDWQKEVLNQVIDFLDTDNNNFGLDILSISLWRVKSFVYNIGINELKLIFAGVKKSLKFAIKRKAETTFQKRYTARIIASAMETLLGVTRLRHNIDGSLNDDKEILQYLSIKHNEEKISNLLELIKLCDKKLKDDSISLPQRISFTIRKQDNNMEPLLLAAYSFLAGNIDSASIKIASITDEE